MPQDETSSGSAAPGGVDAFIAAVSELAQLPPHDSYQRARFVLRMGEEFAFIRLRDLRHPLRFLKQMAGPPPRSFGTAGFAAWLVDDANPARHYTAFVFVGFWLPALLAQGVLVAWEAAGFVRYRGYWSPADVLSGRVGIRHGRLVRRHGPAVLPALIAHDLAEKPLQISASVV